MINTTLCYIEKDGAYLMMHRIKKKNDMNQDKWVGVGGKLEPRESPYDCVKREILEETGLTVSKPIYRGVITFVSDLYGTEYMHLFTAKAENEIINAVCDEGELLWVNKQEIYKLPIWEGDKVFFRLLDEEKEFFSLKLIYSGEKLISYVKE